jgi:hypothetical protein
MSSKEYPYPGAPIGWFVHCTMCENGLPHITIRHKPGQYIYDHYDFSFHYEVVNGRERYWVSEGMNELLRLKGFPLNQIPTEIRNNMRIWYNNICVNADHSKPNIKTAQYLDKPLSHRGFNYGKNKKEK